MSSGVRSFNLTHAAECRLPHRTKVQMKSPAPHSSVRPEDLFSTDYAAARNKFREAAGQIDWKIDSHPITTVGPANEELTIDVAQSTTSEKSLVAVVSTGVHGVEGFFGSAIQLAFLRQLPQLDPRIKCVFVHAVNPYGYAWRRRFNENNIDLNRNFLLPTENHRGSPDGYAELDSLLNPPHPPSRWEFFKLKGYLAISKYGLPKLRRTIASGQYDYPKGLFYGGGEVSESQHILKRHLPDWIGGSEQVVHLDFHTGLGAKSTCKLLIDYPISDHGKTKLSTWFGKETLELSVSNVTAYTARGEFGRWCVSSGFAPEYLFACVEFGTYPSLDVLAGLRTENQSHHYGDPISDSTNRAKENLVELFCPADPGWRQHVVDRGVALINQAIEGLAQTSLSTTADC